MAQEDQEENQEEKRREITAKWFQELRDLMCAKFEQIELDWAELHNAAPEGSGSDQFKPGQFKPRKIEPGKFERKKWKREGGDENGGGGEMSIMRGNVFEKVGVNISTVHGEFSPQFAKEMPGASENPAFFATGISVVAHMKSPLVPAAHFNTRYIETTKSWFGGGGDLTPTYPDNDETAKFHKAFKDACDKYDAALYPKFKAQCDEYFFLKHRLEPRGVGGIFYDYYNTGNFASDFEYTKDVGLAFTRVYEEIVRAKSHMKWTDSEREELLRKRGRYVEFNLLYDRGTKFGLMTGGNIEAILMSLPPEVKWP